MEFLDYILRYIVVPLSGAAIYLFNKVITLETKFAVLRAEADLTKSAHEKERGEDRAMFDKIFAKLDSIEQALRK